VLINLYDDEMVKDKHKFFSIEEKQRFVQGKRVIINGVG